MPSTIKVRVMEARHLPVMDLTSAPGGGQGLTDAYVTLKFAGMEESTRVVRRTLHPKFEQEFRFEVVDDAQLQNEPLELRVLDHDVYSADDLIGTVTIDFNQLLQRGPPADEAEETGGGSGATSLEGWFPLYDTLCGLRGELKVSVSLRLIGDVNPFSDASTGVQLFTVPSLAPDVYELQEALGLVDELLVEADPEFEWRDTFRQARVSNDMRQTSCQRLHAAARRAVGRKARSAGGNAVLGYYCELDLEGDSGIVARAYGTACRIAPIRSLAVEAAPRTSDAAEPEETEPEEAAVVAPRESLGRRSSFAAGASERTGGDGEAALSRQVSGVSAGGVRLHATRPTPLLATTIGGVALLTLTELGAEVRVRAGGLVTARSVKFLGKLAATRSDQETRDLWWSELRAEMRAHARSIACNSVVGYREDITIHNDVAVLTATGTAATLRRRFGLGAVWEGAGEAGLAPPQQEAAVASYAHGTQWNWAQALGSAVGLTPDAAEDIRAGTLPFNHLGEPVTTLNLHPMRSRRGDAMESDFVDGGASADDPSDHRPRRDRAFARRIARRHQRMTPAMEGEEYSDAEPVLLSSLSRSRFGKSATFRSRRLGRPCSSCHVPYNRKMAPFEHMGLVPCNLCHNKWVPEVMLSTAELPAGVPVRGAGRLIQARVARSRTKAVGEQDAIRVSELLPFLEFELARQLLLKLRVMGCNGIFSLRTECTLGGTLICLVATGTAILLEPLPPPRPLLIVVAAETAAATPAQLELARVARELEDRAEANRRYLASLPLPVPNRTRAALLNRSRARKRMKARRAAEKEAFRAALLQRERDEVLAGSQTPAGDDTASGARTGAEGSESEPLGLILDQQSESDQPQVSAPSATKHPKGGTGGMRGSIGGVHAGEGNNALPLSSESSSSDSDGSSSSSSSSSSESDDAGRGAGDDDRPKKAGTAGDPSRTSGEYGRGSGSRRDSQRSPRASGGSGDEGSAGPGDDAHLGLDVAQARRDIRALEAALGGEEDASMGEEAARDLLEAERRRIRKNLENDPKEPFIWELEEETDLDLLAALTDAAAPSIVSLVTAQSVPGSPFCPASLAQGPSVPLSRTLAPRFVTPGKEAADGVPDVAALAAQFLSQERAQAAEGPPGSMTMDRGQVLGPISQPEPKGELPRPAEAGPTASPWKLKPFYPPPAPSARPCGFLTPQAFLVTAVKRAKWNPRGYYDMQGEGPGGEAWSSKANPNRLAMFLDDTYKAVLGRLVMAAGPVAPAALLGLGFRSFISDDDILEIVAQATVTKLRPPPLPKPPSPSSTTAHPRTLFEAHAEALTDPSTTRHLPKLIPPAIEDAISQRARAQIAGSLARMDAATAPVPAGPFSPFNPPLMPMQLAATATAAAVAPPPPLGVSDSPSVDPAGISPPQAPPADLGSPPSAPSVLSSVESDDMAPRPLPSPQLRSAKSEADALFGADPPVPPYHDSQGRRRLSASLDPSLPSPGSANLSSRKVSSHRVLSGKPNGAVDVPGILLTPLGYVPGGRIVDYRGTVTLSFIREVSSAGGGAAPTPAGTVGSLATFYHLVVLEANAVARAHVAAVGGNALVSYVYKCEEAGGRTYRGVGGGGDILVTLSGTAVLVAPLPMDLRRWATEGGTRP